MDAPLRSTSTLSASSYAGGRLRTCAVRIVLAQWNMSPRSCKSWRTWSQIRLTLLLKSTRLRARRPSVSAERRGQERGGRQGEEEDEEIERTSCSSR